MQCPSCKADIPAGSKFCLECGAALLGRCPSCGNANPASAKFCLECGHKLPATGVDSAGRPATDTATPQPSQVAGSAERRQLTVMFCDLVGSTALSARLDPEDMREIMSAYHHRCAEVIGKSGGFVAKYMGDGVLAYFGYPQAHEDDAEQAVRCALALVDALPKLRAGHDAVLQARAGIATGLVVVGDLIGEGVAQEHGVVGETPNLAARLQALAEPGQVVISPGTRRLTGGQFEYRNLGKVALKGLAEPVEAWQVQGASGVESRFEAQHETTLTPLVGRGEELDLLTRRWRQAANGEGQVVLLSGEPGIGKSRLTVALQERLQDEPHTRLRYFCSPHHADSAFYPTIAQLERAAGFERQDTPGSKLGKLASLLGPSSTRESDIQLLAELMSIPTDDRYAPLNWSARQKKEKTVQALVRQLEMLGRQRPVLMIYEDTHWIDPSSRELLDMLVERSARLPVLLVITFRPEFHPPWTGQAHVTTLGLSGLGRREGVALASSVAGKNALPDDIVEEIIERTDGIPLFVEELTKAVVEASVRDGDDVSTLTKAPPLALVVPATLHASLMARLDRLGHVAKDVAQIGAAIGREFSYELVAPVAEKNDAEVQNALSSLTDAGLVFCRGTPPQASFLFKHALVRDVAYSSLLRSQRHQLHARIVAMLEARSPEVVDQQPEILAQHCTEAELNEKAITYWTRAARESMARYAMTEASAQARKGLSVAARLPDKPSRWRHELDLQSTLAGALNASIGASEPETGQIYGHARVLCQRLGDIATLVQVLGGLAAHHAQRCELVAMREIGEELLRVGDKENDTSCRLQGHRVMGGSLYWMGEFLLAQQHLEQALELYVPEAHRSMISVGGFDVRGTALSNLSYILFILGYPDRARSRSHQALKWAREFNNPHVLAHALAMASYYSLACSTIGTAQEVVRELLDLAAEQKFHVWSTAGTVLHGLVVAELGEKAQGLALARQGLADKAATGSSLWVPFHLGFMAKACAGTGEVSEATELLLTALQVAERTGERHFEAELHRFAGECLLAHRHQAQVEAEASFRQAIDVARRQSAKLWELRASISLARLWRDQGKRTEARDLLAPVYGWFTEGFDTLDLKEAKILLDALAP